MNDLRKKDSVADSIQSILEKELSPKQKKIAKMSPPEDKIDAGDLAKLRAGHKPTSEEVEQLDEIGNTPEGKAKLKSYVRKAGDQVDQHWAKVHNKSHLPTDEKMAKRNVGVGAASSRLHGFGINKSTENKVTGRFDYRKAVGKTHVFNKEEVEQIDELKKSTVKSYIAKKSEKLPGKDPKKDMANLMTAHHRVTGVKPTSESFKTFRTFKEEIEEPILDELINEVLGKDASAGDWIHDFVHSDNPKFKGKSKAKRKEMALAAYYAKQRNEEVEVEESTNPFSPDYKSQMKSKPGEKAGFDSKKISTGTVFSKKHKVEPEDDKKKVNEMKRPESDTVPFVSDVTEQTPLMKAKDLAKKTMKKVKNEMMGKTGTSE